MGRPRIHASDAERQAAYRARHAIVEARLSADTAATLDNIAQQLDVSRAEVIGSMVAFALLNRDWTRSLFRTRA